jgi:hypothetical protein
VCAEGEGRTRLGGAPRVVAHLVAHLVVLVVALGPALASPLALEARQEVAPPLALRVDGASSALRMTLGPILEREAVRSSLEAGLPVRIRIVHELWRVRTFDAQEGRHEWRATVRLDPLSGRYLVETATDPPREVASPAAARLILQEGLASPLRPTASGRHYYLARIEMETLSLSDLDELRRWLRGELGPAVEGRQEVGSALGRGLRRLLVRALRLPVQRFETRTPIFEVPGP